MTDRDRYSGISLETVRKFRSALSKKRDDGVADEPRTTALERVRRAAASRHLTIRRARVRT